MKRTYGFTIVELLIVIVVIAILAAISVAAYTNITDRANDSAVQSDLSNIAKAFSLYKIDSPADIYPSTALASGVTSPDFRIAISKEAYRAESTGYNLLNCRINTGHEYAMIAQSKSGKYFMVSSSNPSVRVVTESVTLEDTSSCPIIAPGSGAYGAGYSGGAWRTWTNG